MHHWVEVKDATQPAVLLARAVQRYAPSTLQRYLAVWRQWCQFATCSASNPAAPASGILPDWLLQNSSRQGLASGPWKALSWMSRVAGLPALHQALNTAVAKAFLHASSPQPRREALPFSLSFVCWLERRVMSTDSSLPDRYAAGCLLCAIWGSFTLGCCGWRHPQSTFNWSRAAWSASLPGPKLPRPACTGVHCCLASLGLLLPAGASHFGRCCLRSCISHVE